MLSYAAVGSISLYQRWLSPRKGFCCAHRVLHRGPSCSEFMKMRCRKTGFTAALRDLRLRFLECREAAKTIRQRKVLMAQLEEEAESLPSIAGQPIGTAGDAKPAVKSKPSPSSTCGPDPSCCMVADCGFTGCEGAEACGGIAACA